MNPTPGTRFHGVAVGLVTRLDDPDKLTRVAVKLPWLADDIEVWARLAVPVAGNGRGIFWLPEVGDEVLVAFGHGSPDAVFVLGGLYNGKDVPPCPEDQLTDRRVLRSRSGAEIALVDKDGAEAVEIRDKSGKNLITVDTASNTITLRSDAEIKLVAAKKLSLGDGGADLEVRCAKFTVQCTKLDVNDGKLEVV